VRITRRRALSAGSVVGTVVGALVLATVPSVAALASPAHLAAPSSLAKPVYPSQDQVNQAKAAAGAKAAEVAKIKQALAAAQARADAAGLALEQAAEDYDLARVQLGRRAQAAAAADAAAAKARTGLQVARRDVGRIASQEYRDGGVTTLGLLLDSSGPDAVLERASLLGVVGDGTGVAMGRISARRQVADSLGQRAAEALAAQKAAADALEKARERAEKVAKQAQAAAADVATQQARLTAELATLQATSTKLAQQRVSGLAAEARARAAASAAASAARQRLLRAQAGAAGRGHHTSPRSSSSSWSPPSGGGSSHGSSSAGRGAVAWARQQVGLPYQWGAAGPGSYDCSGLTMMAWQSVGVSLSHSSRAQYQETHHVTYSELRPGDLLFYATNTSDPGSIHHVTIYAGAGVMVEAPATGLDVRVASMRYGGLMPYAGRP